MVSSVPCPAIADASLNRLVLVVADREPEQARLRAFFEANGLGVLTAATVGEADRILAASAPDLIVLDLQGGMNDPLSLCRKWGDRTRTGLALLSDSLDPIDQILALELGADLLITRPVHDRLLMAKVRALLRRLVGRDTALLTETPDGAAEWSLNAVTREVAGPSGRRVNLAPVEVKVMHLFMSNPGVLLTSAHAAHFMGGEAPSEPQLRMSISRLRRKLVETGDGDPIRNVRGVGYVYETVTAPQRHPVVPANQTSENTSGNGA